MGLLQPLDVRPDSQKEDSRPGVQAGEMEVTKRHVDTGMEDTRNDRRGCRDRMRENEGGSPAHALMSQAAEL